MKEYAPACDRNKDYILAVLRDALPSTGVVLEIGSGTGQHVAYFAQHLPNLQWQPSDQPGRLDSIEGWRQDVSVNNLLPAVGLNLLMDNWSMENINAIVCINTIHIVAFAGVENLFRLAGRILNPSGVIYVYGPYRYKDRPLEVSNQDFDTWLKHRDPLSGVRDFDTVNKLAKDNGLQLVEDRPMPANNRSIWWQKL